MSKERNALGRKKKHNKENRNAYICVDNWVQAY